jgi:hypothetical protein
LREREREREKQRNRERERERDHVVNKRANTEEKTQWAWLPPCPFTNTHTPKHPWSVLPFHTPHDPSRLSLYLSLSLSLSSFIINTPITTTSTSHSYPSISPLL